MDLGGNGFHIYDCGRLRFAHKAAHNLGNLLHSTEIDVIKQIKFFAWVQPYENRINTAIFDLSWDNLMEPDIEKTIMILLIQFSW